jgi:16S rRNA G966 N2-methylase RsmD
MAGGGVVSDVCLLFERKCQSFDIATRDNRPEIQYHHWNSRDDNWPITGKADLIFFDPPYYIKKEKAYGEKANEKVPSISSYSKESYQIH